MHIYYIDVEDFKKKYDKDFLLPYADIELKNEKRFFEYTIGRFLVKNVAKQKYNIKNTEIKVSKNGKPSFINADLNFSISHSKNIVIACFDKYPCAIDIEYIKDRNLSNLSKYFNKDFDSYEKFYKFWTLKEATYKLGCSYKSMYCNKFLDKYFLTVISSKEFDINKINIEKFLK